MSTSRKAQGTSAAAGRTQKSGKGMSGSNDDGSTKIGTGGNEPPRDQEPGSPKGPKKRSSRG